MSALTTVVRRLAWEGRRAWAALDHGRLTLLAVLCLWVGLEATVIAPLATRHAAVTAQLQAQQAQLQRSAAPGTLAAAASPRQWLDFFPRENARERDLQRVQELAARQGLRLGRADYRAAALPALPLQRFSATLQLQGSYVAQRRFLQAALAAFPHMTVSRISLEQEKDRPGDMRITLELDFHFRAPAGAGGAT